MYPQTVRVPPFRQDLDWLHVRSAPTWEELRGKIVILDFWTYG